MTSRMPLVICLLFLATWTLTHAAAPEAPDRLPDLHTIPAEIDGRTARNAPPLAPDVAEVLAADVYVHRFYEGAGPSVEMDVAYYSQPRVGSSMHSPLNCLPGNGWTMSEPVVRRVMTTAGEREVREVIVSRGTSRWAMTYWYQSRHRVVPDELSARWYRLTDALRRRPTDAALIRVMTPLTGDITTAQSSLASFAAKLIPSVSLRLQ